MVDPYDFVGSPTVMKSRQTRRKSRVNTSKKRRSNEKPQRVPIRQANSTAQTRTRSNTRETDRLLAVSEKENHPNNGFTQLIQTKMMEVKKRQGRQPKKKVDAILEEESSPPLLRKRPRTVDDDDSADFVSAATETNQPGDGQPTNTNDEHVTAGVTTTAACHPRCEAKDYHLMPANKRRRACLCSKRQLDELEFASDSVPSQSQRLSEVEQQPIDEPQLQAVLLPISSSPPPLLLPSSPVMRPAAFTFRLPPVQSISIIQPEEPNEEEGREDLFNISSVLAAPLSPAMPLNSTYIAARRSVSVITQLPPSLLALSTLPLNTTTLSENVPLQSTSSIVQSSRLEPKRSAPTPSLPPVESVSHRQDQETSMTPSIVETVRCTTSTQTDDDYQPSHHQCHDVSACPCVQIYTRSEQLFMASMSIFFRNSISIIPPESSLTTSSNCNKKGNKRPPKLHQNTCSQSTPAIHHMETSMAIEAPAEKNHSNGMNETYVINNKIDITPAVELEPQRSSPVRGDTSTVINETRYDHTKKSDGSSILINIDSRPELTEHKSPTASSSDDEKFGSLVLAMTALKDDQKIVFNRFLETFSVRSSTSIDDTTTHLITDEDGDLSLICPLTGKVLHAVTRHLKVVSYRWLTACLTEQHYVDEIPTYEIVGDAIYNQHNGMSRSRLNHSNDFRLLASYAFHLKCHGCQPFLDNRPLIELIHSTGGLVLKTLNQHIDNIGRQIVILCSKTYLQNKPALQQACRKLNIVCIEPEWLIASIIKFELQPFEPWLCTLYS